MNRHPLTLLNFKRPNGAHVASLVCSLVAFLFVAGFHLVHDHAHDHDHHSVQETEHDEHHDADIFPCDTCVALGTVDLTENHSSEFLPFIRLATASKAAVFRRASCTALAPCSRGPPPALS